MPRNIKNTAIVALAKLFEGNQVRTESIVAALELLCQATAFQRGLVYEIGGTAQFCLREHHPAAGESPQRVEARDLLCQGELDWGDAVLHYIGGEVPPGSAQRRVLELFGARGVILSPMLDGASICGFVVLVQTGQGAPLCREDTAGLAAPLSMLLRYVGVRMYKRKIDQTQLALERVMDNTGIDIYVNDFHNHDILYINHSMAAPYGGVAQLLGKKCWQVLFTGQTGPCAFCPQKHLVDQEGEPTKVYTWDYQRALDGSWFRVFSSAFRWADGRLAHVVSSADITDNKRNEALIQRLANYDELTGLPNRRKLLAECERCIDRAAATDTFYLLFFDIDGFKSINDNLGHDAGDEFLIQLGAFFSSIPLLQGSIYRNGGDEFVAILSDSTVTQANLASLMAFIHRRFETPWNLKRGKAVCGVSIGVACYPEDGTTVDRLLQTADMAMYQAKKAGGGRVCFGRDLITRPWG